MKQVWYRAQDNWWYATIRTGGKLQQLKLLRGANDSQTKQQIDETLFRKFAVHLEQGDDDASGRSFSTHKKGPTENFS